MKRKTNKVKWTRLVILKFITVSPVSVLTYPVRSAVLHTRLTSWAWATGSNPSVSKLCWEKLTCRGMPWYELCVKFSFLFDACPACVSFYRDDMNFERPKRPPFVPSLRWFSQSMRVCCVRDSPFVSIKLPLSRPPPLIKTHVQRVRSGNAYFMSAGAVVCGHSNQVGLSASR